MGPILGAALPVVVALFTDPISALWVTITFIGLQQLEGHIVAPQIFGHTLRINPLLVIFALLLGLQVHGIIGALIALPILSVLRETAVYLHRHLTFEPWNRSSNNLPVSAALSVRALAKRYGGLQALHDVSFELDSGELLAVVGPNGAGKTTLLSIIAGATEPSEGGFELSGGRVGWAPQRAAVYLRLSVRENLELFARLERLDDPGAAAAGCSSRPRWRPGPRSRWGGSPGATASASTWLSP